MTFARFRRKALALVYHVCLTVLAILGIYVIRFVLGKTLGADATLMGVIPVSFLLDAAEVGILARFAFEAFRELGR